METLASSPGLLVLCGGVLLGVGVVVLAAILLGRRLEVTVGKIHAEVTSNGGSSLRDAVDRVAEGLAALAGRVDKLESTPPPPVALAVVNAPPPEAPHP